MRGARIPIVFVTLIVLYFSSVYALYGFTEDATRICIRISARISFIFFSLAFAASAIQYQIKNELSFWLLMNRKYLGITFGIIFMIHLVFLGILQLRFQPVFELAKPSSLIGGGIASIFSFVMLITSFDPIKNKLSPKLWKGIHTIGAYWIAVVFLTTYLKRVNNEWEYLPLFVLLVLAFILRILKLLGLKF